ncbi:hypothetical protein Bca52824_000952 [Brassica carinata]|uniref:Uncharacterized protein n=1 Tax=Brassica carinata TaxID=52824 RepID=A0A8X8BDC1_BRACI|nr:hypothetical protein Bca52824_000952 [Brassica carinata]
MHAEDIASKLKASRISAERLRKERDQLEREKAEIAEEHAREVARLREFHVYEVTRERARVHAAMVAKAKTHFDQFLGRKKRFDEYDDARCLYSQTFGTRKCLQLLKGQGEAIPQERIDFFKSQEEELAVRAKEICPREISEAFVTMSPLVLESSFMNEELLAALSAKALRSKTPVGVNPQSSNVGLIGIEAAAGLQTSEHALEGRSAGSVGAPSVGLGKGVSEGNGKDSTAVVSDNMEEEEEISGFDSGDGKVFWRAIRTDLWARTRSCRFLDRCVSPFSRIRRSSGSQSCLAQGVIDLVSSVLLLLFWLC